MRTLLLVLGLAVLAVLLSASRPASAQTPPPDTGPWTVADQTDWSGNVTLYNDLTVTATGSLNLTGASLIFDCPTRAAFGIIVEPGGKLTAIGSTFSALKASLPFTFVINANSVVDLEFCNLSNVGSFVSTMDTWGIFIHSGSTTITHCKIAQCNVGMLVQGPIAPQITFNEIVNNSDRGIWVKFASPRIGNNRIAGNSYGIYLENDSSPVLLNNDLADNKKDAVYFGGGCNADWTIDGPAAWTNSTVNLRGNLTVQAGGRLTMRGSSLLLTSTADARKYVRVRSGGNLSLLEGSAIDVPAVISGVGAYAFDAESGAGLTIMDSAVHNAGYDSIDLAHAGLFIQSGADITNANLTGNLAAIVCVDTVLQVTNTTLGGDWHLRLANSTVRLLNTTYVPSKARFEDSSSILEVYWYLSVGAVWQNGQGAGGALLSVHDSGGKALFEGAPGPDGWVQRLEAVQVRVTKSGPDDLSTYTLLANRTGFADIIRTVQLTSNREERMVFNDTNPPSVSITSPENGFGTNQTWVLLTGDASDLIGLDRVELKLDDALRWTPLAVGAWSCNITNLSSAAHHVEVRATNHAGLYSSANISFVVDLEPPRLVLDDPIDAVLLVNRTGVRFSGRTTRDADLTIDGVPVQLTADGTFDKLITFSEGRHSVVVMAKDQGGNIVTIGRDITVDTTPPQILVFAPANRTKTPLSEIYLVGKVEPGAKFTVDGSTEQPGPDGSFNVTIRLAGGPQNIELYAEDEAGNGNTTVWVIDRQLEAGTAQSFIGRYGLALAAGAVLLIALLIAAGWALARSKKGQAPPKSTRKMDAPPPEPAGGPDDGTLEWK
jgi:parallel beta-helix repeat protein